MDAVITESSATVRIREIEPAVQSADSAATDTPKKTADALTSLPAHFRYSALAK